MSSSIVFIHVGPTMPPYMADAIEQAALFSTCPLYLVGQRSALSTFQVRHTERVQTVACEDLGVSTLHAAFRKVCPFDRRFRDGFWTLTTERFFYLSTLAERYGLENSVHLESDVMLYADVAILGPKLGELYSGVAVPFDNDNRAMATFAFWRRPQALATFCQFIVDFLVESPDPRLNDMVLLAEARHRLGKLNVDGLPILPRFYAGELRSPLGVGTREPDLFYRNVESLGMIFDTTAIGQYLDGPDPRNFIPRKRHWYELPRIKRPKPPPGPGFINESAIFDPSSFSYRWAADTEGRKIPYVAVGAEKLPIASIHVHGKNLKKFAS
jgi:hypothetical protein